MSREIRRVRGFCVLCLFFVLAFTNFVWAIWIDADGWGQESIDVSSNSATSGWPSIYLDSSRNPHIAWEDSGSGNDQIHYLKWDGTTWVDADGSGQGSINMSDTMGSSYHPSLCLDSSDKPHIAWKDYTPGNYDIYYLKWDGTAWVDADGSGQGSMDILYTSTDSFHPSLCLDSSGNPHIAWFEGFLGNNEIYYLKWNGNAWVDADGTGQESINISSNTGNSGWPSLCLDSADKPHIAWEDDSSGNCDIYYLRWNGTAWVDVAGSSGREQINISNTAAESNVPSLCLDSSGKPHIAWKECIDEIFQDFDIYYLKWNGIAWVDADGSGKGSINVSDNSEDSGYPYLCLDSSGKPHIAWEDNNSGNYDIYYLKWNGTAWVDGDGSGKESINISKNSGDSTIPHLRLDTSDNPHIAWKDDTPGNNDIYYLKWNDPPTLSWTGEPNYITDGLHPETGYRDTTFFYRIKYADVNNDAPASGYPKLHIMKAGTPIADSPFVMSEVDGTDTNYKDGKLYTYTKSGLVAPGGDYTYKFEAKDICNTPATGEPTNPHDGPDVANRTPLLSWTGETDYIDDGLNPESGYPGTDFVYRVKYEDGDNDGPASGYPKVHIMKAGIEIAGSPFPMNEVDSGDTNYSDGKFYTYTKSRLAPGTDYTYYFEAKDIWDGVATGDATGSKDAPDVTNRAPTLSWTGETNYINDGLNPEAGYQDTDFVYRVKYIDEDNDAPASGYPKLHIRKAGTEIAGSPFAMNEVNSEDTTYSDGKLYTYTRSRLAPGTDYTYYFEAKDIWDGVATGDPTSAVNAPDVTNRTPTLSWTGEANYTSDGLNPESGYPNTDFVYRVNYTDQDNDGPASGYPKVHIWKGGAPIDGSPFAMNEVNSGNTTYSDGKLYTYTRSRLAPGTDYTYYFEAKDIWDGVATGDPTSVVDAPDIDNRAPALSWTGETDYTDDGLDPEDGYSGTNFVYRIKYMDEDNDSPAPGYPKLHIKKGETPIAGSPFPMNEVNSGDTTYSDGKLYTYIKSGLMPGTDYTYYFEARDIWDSPAAGAPTSPRDGPIVDIGPPVLKVNPSSLDFRIVPKGETRVRTFTISNVGKATLRGEISADEAWISVNPTSFRDNYLEVSVTVNTETLGAWRTYTGTVTVNSNGGVGTVTVSVVPVELGAIGEVKIQGGENGYVNPLKGEEAEIHFWPSTQGTVNVEIFDLIGLLVWEKSKDVTGVQDSIKWDCRNNENDLVASGIYVVFVKGPGINATKKVAVMK